MRTTTGWLGLLLLALTGCATAIVEPRFESNRPGPAAFTGIAELLDPRQPVDVLLVHGMCTPPDSWARDAIDRLAQWLGGTPGDVSDAEVPGSAIRLVQSEIATPAGAVRANAVLWAPVTRPLKSALCNDQSQPTRMCSPDQQLDRYPYERAPANRVLKDRLLDDCLADALVYQGRARDGISAQMQRAIVQALATSGATKPVQADGMESTAAAATEPLVVVTTSLGSKIAFDAVLKMTQAGPARRAAALATLDRLSHVFMLANQLPILGLADLDLSGHETASPAAAADAAGGYPADPIGALNALRRQRADLRPGPGNRPLQVVAFTDPNDLLSYRLSPSRLGRQADYLIVDVVLSNAPTWLGLVELPDVAHAGYASNDRVRCLVVHGKRPGDDRCAAGR